MTNPFDVILAKLQEMDEKISNIPHAVAVAPPEIIDTKELSKRLNISDETILKWRRKKKIPFFRVGTTIRYDWQTVVEYMKSKNNG